MKNWLALCAIISGIVAFVPRFVEAQTKPDDKIKVLVVTGGHGFSAIPFFKIFHDDPEVTFTPTAQSKAAEAYDRDDLYDYNVIVLYDAPQNITDAQKQKFLGLFDRGIGLVVLHHAYLSYQKWPDYEKIAGAKYLLDNEKIGDVVSPESDYRGNVDIPVTVVDHDHPVTAGISDFLLKDELYFKVRMEPDVHVLWKTGDEVLAWTRTQGKSRIVGTIQGHGASAYSNPNYLKFVYQAIHWTAGRS